MAEETITILRVGTEEAVKSIADLRENVKILKKTLEETQVDTQEGWEKYQSTLEELKINQNALKDAMYATTGTFEDVTKAAVGAGESYNSLVHRMAALKEEFRATGDAARREDLGKEINKINTELKNLDALQGNFQRNVGNYAGGVKDAFADMSKNVDVFRKFLSAVGGGLNGVKDGMEGISKSPFIATIGILVSLVIKLADELKENETSMSALKKGMDALRPVMDFFSGIIETIAQWLADIISEVSQFVTSNGLFSKIIQGVVGVGNAIVQFVLAPFKAVISAIKVFKEEGIKGIGNAAKAFGQELKNGVSFKENFSAGQAVADALIAGGKSRKKKVKDAGKDLGKEMADGFLDQLEKELDKGLEDAINKSLKDEETANKQAVKMAEDRINALDKAYAHQKEMNSLKVEDEKKRAENEYQIEQELNQKKLALLDQFTQQALDRGDLDAYLAFEQQRADLEVEIQDNAVKELARLRKQDLEDAKEKAEQQKAILSGVASATSSILGSIADLYESDEKNSEKNANKVKNLRIAAATIDTLSGALAAYMNAQKTGLPPYVSIPLGIASAAAVTAEGIAQIAKLKSTKVSGSAASSTPSIPAVAPAPTITTEVSQVRSVTSSSEEDRLNQMARDQRVYILSSDIEASQNQIKTQVSESSF
jgi:predicted  nucleic acid-binding Zn-ribbon protein